MPSCVDVLAFSVKRAASPANGVKVLIIIQRSRYVYCIIILCVPKATGRPVGTCLQAGLGDAAGAPGIFIDDSTPPEWKLQ